MRYREPAFAGWPGGARGVAPELFNRRDLQVGRQFAFLLPMLTPRTVFMELASPDAELAMRVAGYVERAWSIGSEGALECAPCNLRRAGLDGVPARSVDVAFSETFENAADIRRVLKQGAVWFVYGELVPLRAMIQAGFAKAAYYAGALRVPRMLARIARHPVSAAHA